jgi:hypothetical protein
MANSNLRHCGLSVLHTARACERHNIGYGYIGARNDTTQQSGQTPDKEVDINHIMPAATLKPIRLQCYLPRLSGSNKVSLFRADSLARQLLQCA